MPPLRPRGRGRRITLRDSTVWERGARPEPQGSGHYEAWNNGGFPVHGTGDGRGCQGDWTGTVHTCGNPRARERGRPACVASTRARWSLSNSSGMPGWPWGWWSLSNASGMPGRPWG